MSSSDQIGHSDRRHTNHNRHFGHRDIGHGGHPISVGCRFDDNRRLGNAFLVIGVARYPGPDRIVSRPVESMYSSARSGEPGPSLCGLPYYIRIARQCETRLADWTLCSVRTLEGFAEAIVLLGKGVLEGAHRKSRAVMCSIEGENARYYLLDSLGGEVSKCESRP